MSISFPLVGISRALGKYVAVFALVASGLTLGVAGIASATSNISEVAGFPVNAENPGGNTINISPHAVGDIVILSSQIHSPTITVTGVASADTGSWTMAKRYIGTNSTVITEEVWYATVTATTAATPITVTYSASITSPSLSPELVADSFTTSVPSTWSTVAGGGTSATSTTAITYPTVTSGSGSSQLYWGYSESTTQGVAGSSAGFTYAPTLNGNLSLFNPALAPSTAYTPTATQTPAGDTTSIAEIFAATANPTTVTFDNNGGAGTLAAETTNTPTALSLFSTGNMTKAGFHFTGWNTTANGSGTSYADGATYPFTASATLYAQWVANIVTFTVTFNNNGGQGSLASETASSPTALTLFQTGNMTQTNSYFTGWNTSPSGNGTTYADGSTYPFTSSTTLYAQWHASFATPPLLSLGITAASGTVNYGSPFTPSAVVSAGLTAGDTAVVSGTTYTYAGTGATTYAASSTAPSAVGTYSVKPSGATVTVNPAADQSKYSTIYAYVSGALTISAPTLSVTAGNVSIKVGGAVTPSATVSGVVGSDGATVSKATYTYTGTGSTTYPASITVPTAAGTYSITPSAATVTVTPVADAPNYGTNYTYVPGTLTISAVVKPPVVLRATHISGVITHGHRAKITIDGTGFAGRPKVTSSSRGTVVVVSKVTGTHLTVWVKVSRSTRPGHATLTIRLANGKTCKIGYVIK